MASWRAKPLVPRAADQGVPGRAGVAAGAAPVVFAPDLHDSRHLRLKAALLLVWALVSFGVCFFARDLQWMVGGWPLDYWVASQGAVLVFMVIVVVYATAMSYFERQDTEAAAASAAPASAPAPASASVPASADAARSEAAGAAPAQTPPAQAVSAETVKKGQPQAATLPAAAAAAAARSGRSTHG